MPLGDPEGGMFEYTTEGLPESIKAVTIHVQNVDGSAKFYSNILRMTLISKNDDEAIFSFGGSYLILKKGNGTGTDTGVFLGVTDPFEFHRRMVDDGVVFIRHPERGSLGVYASFRDPDENVLHVVEKERAKRSN